ncbi:hypothetical protein JKP88DRAFT_255594 [Tribonema minus]|uniref:Uncharacterized protein n=1 Tax=Tribonema minus TaxID=303371 RepID=A0A836CGA9_9STRA|nr:hypothetical protein JKP88DRAFT_255594 [Tribonema minus]
MMKRARTDDAGEDVPGAQPQDHQTVSSVVFKCQAVEYEVPMEVLLTTEKVPMLRNWALSDTYKDAPLQCGSQLLVTLTPSQDINPAMLYDVFSFVTKGTLPSDISPGLLRQLHFFGMEQPSHLPANYFTRIERADLEYDSCIFIHRLINTNGRGEGWSYDADAYKYVMAYPDILREQALIKFGLNITVADCPATDSTCVAVYWGGADEDRYDLEFKPGPDDEDMFTAPIIATMTHRVEPASDEGPFSQDLTVDGHTIGFAAHLADDNWVVSCCLPEAFQRQQLSPIYFNVCASAQFDRCDCNHTGVLDNAHVGFLHHGHLFRHLFRAANSKGPLAIALRRGTSFKAQYFMELDAIDPSLRDRETPQRAVAISLKLV